MKKIKTKKEVSMNEDKLKALEGLNA